MGGSWRHEHIMHDDWNLHDTRGSCQSVDEGECLSRIWWDNLILYSEQKLFQDTLWEWKFLVNIEYFKNVMNHINIKILIQHI